MILAAAALLLGGFYWLINRHKPVMNILAQLHHNLQMQGAGLGGIIDDWWNRARNNIEIPDAPTRIAIVTGGARGIGVEVAKGLLKANMTVIVGVRKPKLAERALADAVNYDRLTAFELDLESMTSVRQFAARVLEKHPEVHVLVNNAGIMFGKYRLTEDGFESQLAVNHLGHFYLTHLLLPALKRGGASGELSRVVNVTSCAHYPGKVYFDDINLTKYYDADIGYSQSKLCQLLSARYINKLMEEENAPVRCYSVHPGLVDTDLFQGTIFKTLFPWMSQFFFKSPEKGATTILYACFEKSLSTKGGLYISNCREGISNGFSKNVDNQKKLHNISCELLKIDDNKFGTI